MVEGCESRFLTFGEYLLEDGDMFGPLGIPELLFILALALLIFGPRRLPEVGRTIGKSLAEFRRASTDLKRTINAELIQEELAANNPRTLVEKEVKEIKATVARSMDMAEKPGKSESGADQAKLAEVRTGSEPAEPEA